MSSGKKVFSSSQIKSVIKRIVRAILKNNQDRSSLAVIGIHQRGVPLAERLQKELARLTRSRLDLGTLDITLYRDDLDTVGHHNVEVKSTRIDFDLNGKNVILVDDVLFTGRTVRAALDELVDFGRPRSIQLAVLIDRGHRELPIQADYVGKTIRTKRSQIVKVNLKETDGRDEVVLFTAEAQSSRR